jgi:hypothetical protein
VRTPSGDATIVAALAVEVRATLHSWVAGGYTDEDSASVTRHAL